MKKSILKKAGIIALCVSMIGVFASCGSSSSDKNSKKNEKTYKVVFEATYPPFDTTDDDGNPDGFDVDLMNAIGKAAGFKVKFTTMSFDALIPAVQAGNADIIASGMNADDPARQKKVDFGLYIGEVIQLYYDEPTDAELPLLMFTLEYDKENPYGTTFV
ncbi:MAG: transporter substrate-binding domain-containing protein, partial [Anaerovoracaceae bacterium]